MKYRVCVAYKTKREAVECYATVEGKSLSAAVANHMDRMLKGYPAREFLFAKGGVDESETIMAGPKP